MRSGKCAAGEYACERAVSSGKARLIVVDCEASDNTRRRWSEQCSRADVPFAVIEGAAAAAGKPDKRVLAVLDEGFARMILDAVHPNTTMD